MRVLTILLLVLSLAAIGLTGYLYFNTNVVLTEIECTAADPADTELFSLLKDQTERNIFTGTRFDDSPIGDAELYQFYTYTVHLRNETFVRADVAEVQITPMNGDILQTEETEPVYISARSEGTVRGTILTGRDMHNIRELTVTYYLWGLPFSQRMTYSNQ